jgi:hypothetical protein
MRSAILQLACHASLALPVAAGPQVNLGYATYDGITLANGVNQFLGMRYAAPPTGLRRFKRPMAPLHEAGVIQAKEVCNEFSWNGDPTPLLAASLTT